MPIPNFFLIGAGSSGTTSLYHYLRQHPDVYMSPLKEPCYFAPELLEHPALRPGAIVSTWNEYLALFDGVRNETVIGEASVAYLMSRRAPVLIAERTPDAKILAVLRDPADRLFARFTAARAAGTAKRFRDWAEAEIAREAARPLPVGNVLTGYYAAHLTRWFANVPPARRMVLLYDELRDDTPAAVRRVFEFLGIDPRHPVDLAERHNVTRHVRWPLLMRLPLDARRMIGALTPARGRRWFRSAPAPLPTPSERAWAVQLYASDVAALERLLDRDLTAWRAGAG